MVRERRVFTTGEIAKICKVAPRTVSKWFDSGRLQGYRIPGSQDRRIPHRHLIQFLKENGMPLDGLEEDRLRMLVVGNGHMTNLAKRLADCVGEEMSIERCETLFQAGLRLANEQIQVVLVEVAAHGVQETVQAMRDQDDLMVIFGVREAGATSMVEGIAEYFTPDETPELVVTRANCLLKRKGKANC